MIGLSSRELATALAALRYWQQDLDGNDEPPISEHFHDTEPLSVQEVNQLCERLNNRLTLLCTGCEKSLTLNELEPCERVYMCRHCQEIKFRVKAK